MSSSQGEGTVFGHRRRITLFRVLQLIVRSGPSILLIMASILIPHVSRAETVTISVDVGNTPNAVAVNSKTNRIYVANYYSNNVTVIDGVANSTTSVDVGARPSAIAVNEKYNKIYVLNQEEMGNSTVKVIDGFTDTVTGTITVEYFFRTIYPASPMAVDAEANKVYVANYYSNNVTVIDGVNNTTTKVDVGGRPIAIAVNTKTHKVYVTNSTSNSITVIDGSENNSTTNLNVEENPIAIAVNTKTNKVYVANFSSNSVTIIDGNNNSTTTVAVGTNPYAIAVNTETNQVYVTNFSSNSVTIIDGNNNNSTTTVTVGTNPYDIAVNIGTNKAYVTNRGSDSVTVIDGTNTPVNLTTPDGHVPSVLAVAPDTNKVYVANYASNSVTIIQNFYSVRITRSDNSTGNGSVTSSPGGISCGAACSALFPEGLAVIMFQMPDSSSGFSGWGGACSGTGDCAFSMLSDKAVSAVFVSEPLVKNQNTGVAYGILQDAYNEAKDNHVISARSALTAPGLNLNKATILTIEGGYNADYSSCTGLTTVLGRVNVGLAPLFVRGLAIKVAP